uniref:Uncharacterized protein n=1 Tax=Chelonoidis abingdonii TaxID=106734 RepID=A0A8C0ITL0_CHEAB
MKKIIAWQLSFLYCQPVSGSPRYREALLPFCSSFKGSSWSRNTIIAQFYSSTQNKKECSMLFFKNLSLCLCALVNWGLRTVGSLK